MFLFRIPLFACAYICTFQTQCDTHAPYNPLAKTRFGKCRFYTSTQSNQNQTYFSYSDPTLMESSPRVVAASSQKPAVEQNKSTLVHASWKSRGHTLTASRRGQDKPGHHSGAAIPHNQLSWGNGATWCNIWQNFTTYDKQCAPLSN